MPNFFSGIIMLLKVMTPVILIGGLIVYIIKCWFDSRIK